MFLDDEFEEETRDSRFRFRPAHDVTLLRQVLSDEPFVAPYRKVDEAWNEVGSRLREVGVRAQTRTIRERFAMLLRKFSPEIPSLRKSGTNAQFAERE